jgi:folate-binding Fe-S cluster repair protein YgfZ
MTNTLGEEYRALTAAAGVADVSDRTFVELTGADRAKFLHNLCSNEILRLTPGRGCEALLLNAKGRVVGHVFVYGSEDSLILDSSPGQGEKLVSHLDRYIIREKVELRDCTAEMSQLLLAGPQAATLLETLG